MHLGKCPGFRAKASRNDSEKKKWRKKRNTVIPACIQRESIFVQFNGFPLKACGNDKRKEKKEKTSVMLNLIQHLRTAFGIPCIHRMSAGLCELRKSITE